MFPIDTAMKTFPQLAIAFKLVMGPDTDTKRPTSDGSMTNHPRSLGITNSSRLQDRLYINTDSTPGSASSSKGFSVHVLEKGAVELAVTPQPPQFFS